MEFSDLNEDICADSWRIESNEISRKRLIRQTPRYNIYKADWFGDVLVYEPNQATRERADRFVHEPDSSNYKQLVEDDSDSQQDELDCKELSVRLSELNLSSNLSLNLSLDSEEYASEQTDSAYSSISSTPKYHTKSEFDFQIPVENKCKSERNQHSSSPLVLNKSTFQIASRDNDFQMNGKTAEADSWLTEINELRLIAHESFMLFMGFSVASQDTVFQTTSLVMQINHPKATSLYNLLHASSLVGIDR